MRRYLALWWDVLRLSLRRAPGSTCAVFVIYALDVVAMAGIALALQASVDATQRGSVSMAVTGACAAALSYGASAALVGLSSNLPAAVADKVAMQDLHPQVYRDICTIEGLEHLERSDYLDRVTVVRNAGWVVATSLWQSLAALFAVVRLVVSLVLLSSVSPWLLGLLPFASVPLWFDHRGKQAVASAEVATAESYRLQQRLFELGTDAGAGKEIRVAGTGARIAALQAAAWDQAMRPRVRARLVAALWKLGGWLLFGLAFIAALGLVTVRAAKGHGTAGEVMLAVTVAMGLRESVQTAVGSSTEAMGAQRVIEPYLWLRDFAEKERARPRSGARVPDRLRQGITFDRVSYRYPGTTSQALNELSVEIPAGSVVAVIGEYGSGKTTLVKLLCRMYEPTSGSIRVDGVELGELDVDQWRARLSAAFQDFGRFQTVFAEGIGLGDLPHLDDLDRIERAVSDADAATLVSRLPDGLGTQLGRELGGIDLSEGQWQRVALARAAMREEPLLFVLDEPTASLDAPSEDAIFQRHMQRARQLAERTGAITVIVSHRFSTVTGADAILVLDQGRLVEAGTHEELRARGGRYAELYGIQADAYATHEGDELKWKTP
ncbi:ABC transporter ATP-binding protein [Streptomyces sp. NPDC048751]|uniref:ABC transporter ATP-binding protein n=1 Tax=Streptomyces sp. NPDC048751 TaxID=3365591 RepID=UPI0037173730